MRYDVVSSFDCDASEVGRARKWVHAELTGLLPAQSPGEIVEDAALIVSELLTNAIRAGCELVTIGLALHPGCLRLGVSDDAPGFPVLRATAASDDAGRGLPIVSTLAQDWGVERPDAADGRKEVWAVLALR